MSTETKTVTPAQRKAASNALYAWEGACNGIGVTQSLVEAYRAFGPDTDERNKAVPVKIMLLQLCHLADIRIDTDMRDLTEIITECERMAGFKLVEGKKMRIDGYKEVEVVEEKKPGGSD